MGEPRWPRQGASKLPATKTFSPFDDSRRMYTDDACANDARGGALIYSTYLNVGGIKSTSNDLDMRQTSMCFRRGCLPLFRSRAGRGRRACQPSHSRAFHDIFFIFFAFRLCLWA